MGKEEMIDKRANIKRVNLIQLGLSLTIIVLLNIIGSYLFTRFDLTSEKRYSLSNATKNLLKEVDDIIYFKIYLEGEFPAGFKRLSRETKEMLDEFRAYNNKIQYDFINPSKAGTAGEVNRFYEELVRKGLNPTDLQVKTYDGRSQKIIFPGALVTYRSRELPLHLLQSQIGMPPEAILNNSIQALEYNISSVIKKLIVGNKPKIAFIEGHGELEEIYVHDITNTLSEYYNTERVMIDGKVSSLTHRDTTHDGKVIVQNRYEAIIIAQPDSTFSEIDKFVIDQFIMRGGKVLWLIDPVYATMDSLELSSQTLGLARDLNLDDMLFKYGVRLNPNLLLDLNALPIRIVTGIIDNQPQINFLPWFYFPVILPTSNHPVVNNLNAITTSFISSIDTINNPEVRKTILLTTSPYSRAIKSPVLIDLKILEEEPDERLFRMANIPVAVLLEGRFKSVFENRITPEIKGDRLIDFKEVSLLNKMIVIADGDIIRNQLHVAQGYPLPLGFDQYTRQSFGNSDLILNAMNYLCDDSGLIISRSKEVKLRLLDKTRLKNHKLSWQLLNTLLPVILVLVFGIIKSRLRKRKFTQ